MTGECNYCGGEIVEVDYADEQPSKWEIWYVGICDNCGEYHFTSVDSPAMDAAMEARHDFDYPYPY